MTTQPYRFDADRIEILQHADGSSHILIWGSAIDPDADEDNFELTINEKPYPVRVRRMENPAINPEPGSRPGYVMRIEVPAKLQPEEMEVLTLSYNGKETKTFPQDFLRASWNKKGFDFSVDLLDVRKNKLLIGGWMMAVDPEDLKVEVIDANGDRIKDARVTMNTRFDVRRFYFVQTEKLTGYNVSIKDADKIAMPVALRVSNSKEEWLLPTVPNQFPEPEPEEIPEPEPPAPPKRTPITIAKGGLRRIKHLILPPKEIPQPEPETPAEETPVPETPAETAANESAARPAEEQAAEEVPAAAEPAKEMSSEETASEQTPSEDTADVNAAALEQEQAVKETVEAVEEDFNDQYNRWFEKHRTKEEELARQRKEHFAYSPLISLIVAAYNTPIDLLEKMIDSVKEQTYSNWQLCIADGSTNDTVETWLKAHPDEKISWTRLHDNLGISGNMNAAADLARGDVIALYDHDDFLEPDALYEVVKAFNEHDYDYVYTDEDKYEDSTGRYVGPNFKPDYSPALLQSTNYVCHFLAMKKEAYDRAGGTLRSEYDGAQDFDLMLRLMDVTKPEKVGHIPKILYHWRMHDGSTALDADSKLWAYDAGGRALEDWARRNHNHGKILETDIPGHYHMRFDVPSQPKISIIIPNKDLADDLDFCVSSIEKMSDYRNFEIIIVENNSEKRSTFKKYRELKRKYKNVRVVTWRKPFNYSAINNFGVKYAKGDYLLFLNNDTEAIDSHLLAEMLGQAVQPNVGAVGAKLYYEDGTLQHNGIVIGHAGVAGHGLIGQTDENINYRVRTTYNVSAVTGACMMVPKKVFEEVGGFREDLPVAYNDVDLCLRIREAGYWIVQNPFAIMFHYESRSRGYEDTPEKLARFENDVRKMYDLWPDVLRSPDPFYNPNFDINKVSYQLRDDDEINSWINPVFLGDAYYTAGTIRPPKPTKEQMERLSKVSHLQKYLKNQPNSGK